MRSPLVYGLIAVTIVFTVAGQLLVKQGTLQLGAFPKSWAGAGPFIVAALTNAWIVAGLACAAAAALAWIGAVSLSDISFAYPFMALAIVLVLALSPLLFDERISTLRWAGVAIVALGIWIASR
jgi:drug/metabolite transporter (DMT)-like permease